ncbi:hypothetical protein [Streptomyces platensis]|uniref:hypothetical protein n=1 Tax=Streptomyces platensis TaxID=58346 RepID=UPI0037A4AEA2
MTGELSGADLARQALVAAQEAAKKKGTGAIGRMMTERGVVVPAADGSILAQWEAIPAAAAPAATGTTA